MAAKLSTALVTKLMDTGAFKDIFANCVIDVWSGTQPASADAAATGTLLVSVTKSSGVFTSETRAAGTLTIAGAAGSIDTITVAGDDVLGGAVAFTTDLTTTAAAIVARINSNPKNLLYVASSAGAVVTLTAVNGLGVLPNTKVIAYTATTMTATAAPMAGGVDAVNGLQFGTASAGVLTKAPLETWSGNAVATATAGWFRVRASGDAGSAADTSLIYPRFDGAISTSGAQMNIGSLAITTGAPFVLSSAAFTLPML